MSVIPTVAVCVMASPLDMANGMNSRVSAKNMAPTKRGKACRPDR